MKNLKRALLTGTITIATLISMTAISKAATVEITGEVVNIRESASIEANVVTALPEGIECEYLGEEGDWYKVKYQNYTGYASKQYTKLIEDTTNTTQTDTKPENNKEGNNKEEDSKEDNNKTDNGSENGDNQNTNNDDTQNEPKLVYKKFNQNTIIRILPLIYSGNIGEAKKDNEVLVLAETTGWTYIQTDEISGWVRTDTLGSATTVATSGSGNQGSTTSKEKTGYISEEEVNMREGAGTSYSVIKVLKLNNQVTILEEEGNWYKVKSGDDTGFVSKDYVSDSKVVTNRSLSEARTAQGDEETTDKEEKDTSKKSTTDNKTTTNSTAVSDKTVTTSNKTESNKTETTDTKTSNSTNKNSASTASNSTIKGTDVIAYAKKYIGVPYVWGGASTKGFDCSGFTMYVYKHFGVSIPHYTVSQYNSSKGTKITKQSDLKMGDIVFLTDYQTGAACGHCGIYISNGNFIHADSSVGHVNISNLNGIYKGRFCGALRIKGVEN